MLTLVCYCSANSNPHINDTVVDLLKCRQADGDGQKQRDGSCLIRRNPVLSLWTYVFTGTRSGSRDVVFL